MLTGGISCWGAWDVWLPLPPELSREAMEIKSHAPQMLFPAKKCGDVDFQPWLCFQVDHWLFVIWPALKYLDLLPGQPSSLGLALWAHELLH